MGRKVQRAAGTNTFTDLLRHPSRFFEQLAGDARPRAEADVAALKAGEAREVSAFLREGPRFRQGSLILDPAAASPVVWRPFRVLRRSDDHITLVAPFHVYSVGPITGPGSRTIDTRVFRLLSLQAADRPWELAVPAMDVALVHTALHGNGTGT